MPVLIGGRLLQGFGAGGIAPVAYVAIARALPADLRPRMFAMLSTAWVVPGVIGPALSGVIAEHLSWRVVFLGLLPLIAIAAALTIPALARVAPAPADGGPRRPPASGGAWSARSSWRSGPGSCSSA